MINAVLMASNDDVVTVTQAVTAGGEICYQREGETFSLAAATDVPLYHKAALRDLAEGAPSSSMASISATPPGPSAVGNTSTRRI